MKKNPVFIKKLAFTKINYFVFLLSLVFIVAGYVIMAKGEVYSFQSLSVAPVVLLIGYLVLLPASILYRDKKDK